MYGSLTCLTNLNVQHLAAELSVLAACVPFVNISDAHWTAFRRP